MSTATVTGEPKTSNVQLLNWVQQMADLCKPDSVHWCDGSQEEWDSLSDLLVHKGTFIRLNPEKHPNSFLARSNPSDVARVEDRTFICSLRESDAGPTNNWAPQEMMRRTLRSKFDGSMQGRTMYVVPFCMGPLGSPLAIFGVQLTDSPYVVVNMRIMCHMGKEILDASAAIGRTFPACIALGCH